MQKKVFWITFSIMALVLIVLAFSIWFGKKPESPIRNIACEPYKNIEIIVKNGDLTACDCLAEGEAKIKCQRDILNAILYANALKQTDPAMCAEISQIDMNDDCVNLVKSNAEFAKKNNLLSASSSNSKN